MLQKQIKKFRNIKKTNFIIAVSILLMLNQTLKSQSYGCGTANSSSSIIYSGCISCTSLNDYIPDQIKDSIMYVRLNIYFTLPTTGYQGPFANVTITEANNLVADMNYLLDSLWSANLLVSPPPQYIKRSRIRFKLNSYQKFADDAIYYGPDVPSNVFNGATTVAPPSYYNNSTAITAIFNVDTNTWNGMIPSNAGGYGIAVSAPGTYLNMRANVNQTQTFLSYQNFLTLLHEIGHCLGLAHTNTYQSCITDYKFEDPSIWNVSGGLCTGDTTRSNNVMGYNYNCRYYFTPLQLATMYQNAKINLNDRIVITPNNYIIGANPNFNYNVTTNETWTINRYFKGNITVKSGKTLTVKCQLAMAENAKILVETGAKLLIDGGEVTNLFGKLWKGIEIAGASTQNQNLSGGYGVYQGYVNIINGGTISNAVTAITTGTTDAYGTFDWSSTGGIVIASTANFINNIKDVAFLYYHSSTGGNLGNFTRCNFKTNALLNNGGVPDSRVSLYEIDGVKFYGNSFEYNAGSAYTIVNRGMGINSIDASYSIDEICNGGTPCGSYTRNHFSNFTQGVYVNNTNALRVVSIANTDFYDNYQYSTYFNTINTPVFTDNYVRTLGSNGAGVGLYLNNCKYYNVKNNTFLENSSGSANTDKGIYVNNSQSGAHKIYRNSFANFWLAISPINDNSGLTNNTDGLLINCNDFTPVANLYDIAVQNTGMTIPTVMKNQGIATADFKSLVRNKYAAVSSGSTGENKWFIVGTSYKKIQHTANSDANTRPTPQPANSDDSVNVINSGHALVYSSECPATETGGGGGGGRLANINAAISNLTANNAANNRTSNPEASTNLFDLQAAVAEKLNYFLLDSAASSKDSVIALLQNNPGNMADADVQLTNAYLNKGDLVHAQQNAIALAATKPDWSALQLKLITLHQNGSKTMSLKNDGDAKAFFENYVLNDQKDGIGAANAILKFATGKDYFIPQPVPYVENGVNRSRNNPVLDESMINNGFSVYPNPANNLVNIIYKGKSENTINLILTNTLGETIYQKGIKANNRLEIDLTALVNGVYLLTAYDGKEKVYQTKVICVK